MKTLNQVFWISMIFSLLLVRIAHAEPDYAKLSTAILKAEGNPNYGILAHYKHTSYRQACINTCRHKWLEWLRTGQQKEAYLSYLSKKYAPIGAKNDPHDLNKNWLHNVMFYYKESQ